MEPFYVCLLLRSSCCPRPKGTVPLTAVDMLLKSSEHNCKLEWMLLLVSVRMYVERLVLNGGGRVGICRHPS